MKNYFRYSLVLVVLVSLLASCSVSNLSIEKRRYRKGFHVSSSESRNGGKVATESVALEETNASVSEEAIAEVPSVAVNEPVAAQEESFAVIPNGFVAAKLEKELAEAPKSSSVAKRMEVKALNKAMKMEKKSQKSPFAEPDKVLLVILAILIPPLAVYLHQDEINKKFWVNLILTLLCGIPGVIHALIVVLRD